MKLFYSSEYPVSGINEEVIGYISIPSNSFEGIEVWEVIPSRGMGKLRNTNSGEELVPNTDGFLNYQCYKGTVQIQFAWDTDNASCDLLEVTVMEC